MSFQYIQYSSLPHDTPSATVYSRSMPAALAKSLAVLCRADAPLHSYRLLTYGSTIFHVLSCRKSEAEAYSIHHLVLSQDEMLALRRNASRPTPAGVILALYNIGFWLPTAETAKDTVNTEPRLTAAALPDASEQAVWKKITGHKSNAKILLTAPYDNSCIICPPPDTTQEEILGLLHESDWISIARGWGRSFTTTGTDDSQHAEFQRIVIPGGTTSEQRHSAVLNVSAEMNPEVAEAETTTEQTQVPFPHPADEVRPRYPYRYTETIDEDVFNVLPRPHKWVRWVCILGGVWVLWSGVSLVSGLFMDEAGEVTGTIITTINTSEHVYLLEELANAPYSAESTARKLDKLEAHLSTLPTGASTPRRQLLRECIDLLRSASADAHGHPSNLEQLYTKAKELKLNASALCRLYMNEATHDHSTDEWQNNMGGTELQAWQQLLQSHPDLAEWLQQPPFREFMPDYTDSAHADNPTPATETEGTLTPEQSPQPAAAAPSTLPQPPRTEQLAEALTPQILLHGSPLPDILAHKLTKEPTSLEVQSYDVVPMGNALQGQAPQSTDTAIVLSITPGNEEQVWLLRHQPDAPPLRLETKNGKISSLTLNGEPAALKLKLADEQHRLCTYMFIPRQELPLYGLATSALPKATEAQLRLTPEQLVLAAPTRETPHKRLDVQPEHNFSALNTSIPLQLQPGQTLSLPLFSTRNRIIITHSATNGIIHYTCTANKLDSSHRLCDLYNLQLRQNYNFAEPVLKTFLQTANTSCCGKLPQGDRLYSLATLYELAAPQNATLPVKQHSQLVEHYRRLFSHARFAKQLATIFKEEPQLCLTPDEARGRGNSHNRARNRISSELRKKTSLRTIREGICRTLSQDIRQTYLAEYNRCSTQNSAQLILRLENVSLEQDGALIWYYTLSPLTSP